MKFTNVHANKVAEIALKYLQDSHNHWPDDEEMLRVGTKDYLDFMKIANMIENKNYKDAAKAAWDLDTVVRDYIPNSVFNYLQPNI